MIWLYRNAHGACHAGRAPLVSRLSVRRSSVDGDRGEKYVVRGAGGARGARPPGREDAAETIKVGGVEAAGIPKPPAGAAAAAGARRADGHHGPVSTGSKSKSKSKFENFVPVCPLEFYPTGPSFKNILTFTLQYCFRAGFGARVVRTMPTEAAALDEIKELRAQLAAIDVSIGSVGDELREVKRRVRQRARAAHTLRTSARHRTEISHVLAGASTPADVPPPKRAVVRAFVCGDDVAAGFRRPQEAHSEKPPRPLRQHEETHRRIFGDGGVPTGRAQPAITRVITPRDGWPDVALRKAKRVATVRGTAVVHTLPAADGGRARANALQRLSLIHI